MLVFLTKVGTEDDDEERFLVHMDAVISICRNGSGSSILMFDHSVIEVTESMEEIRDKSRAERL